MATTHNSVQRLHTLLRQQNKSLADKQEIVTRIRNGCYDMPDASFVFAYQLLEAEGKSDHRFINTDELIHSGLQLHLRGDQIKGYLQSFFKGIGSLPYLEKLAQFINYVLSEQPSQHHFKQLIADDAGDSESLKRSLTVYKREGRLDDYVRALNGYLKNNPGDSEVWIQLGEINIERSHYLRALFCYEEVIVLLPDNDHYFTRLAEVYYTHGGKHNLAVALKYYAYVVGRNPKNCRALWGLYRTLLALGKDLQPKQKELLQKTKEGLIKMYKLNQPQINIELAL